MPLHPARRISASKPFAYLLFSSPLKPVAQALTLTFAWSCTAVFAQVTETPAHISEDAKSLGYSTVRFLAKARPDAPAEELAAIESQEGVRLHHRLKSRSEMRVLEVADGETVLDAIERLRASGRYDFVEPDYIMKAHATPNDPRFVNGDQWALRNTGQSGGTAGADVSAEAGWEIQSSAANITVAVIDSGILRTHEDLARNLWVNPQEQTANGRDDDGNGYIDDVNGIDATRPLNTAGNGTPSDGDGHGTAVASVIGAAGNNGVGMAGVAWNVKMMSLRFLDDYGLGFVSDEIECIDYAIAKGAQVINISSGSTAYSQALYDALKRARDAGIIVVCSAGNDGDNTDLSPHYPSNYLLENILAVANTNRTDALSSTSSYGSGIVELGAPGSSILVAANTGDRNYQFFSGTSFSAPMVTGAIALIKAKFPSEGYRDTINRVLRSVDAKPALAGKVATGGRLNIAAALRTTTSRPYNDDFAQRAVLTGESLIARAAAQSSTREAGEPIHAGATGAGSLWWSWTAPRNGSVTFDTTGSTADTLLAVYTGSAVASLTSVASNDNESSSLTTSKVTFSAQAGTTYQICVDAKGSASGLVLLRLALLASNDDFASAQTVSGRSWSVRSDNRSASREAGEPRIRNNAGGNSVWYKWTAPATRRYHVATFSSDFNTMLGIYIGNSLSGLTEVAGVTTAGDSNFTMSSAGTTFAATAGTTYYIAVDSEVSSAGAKSTGDFNLSCVDSDWEFFGWGPIGSVALAADGTLHFADDFGYLYALNADGTSKWRYTLTGYGTTSSPAVATDGTVYVGDEEGYVHAVTSTGARKWRTLTGGRIQSAPAIAADGTVYVRPDNGRLMALNPADGTTKWTFTMGISNVSTSYTSPVVAPDGTIYCAGSDSKMYAITPTGTLKWSFATDFILSSPAVATDGTIYFGVVAPTRRVYALNPDGTVKWDFVAGDTVSSSPSIGPDGTIYFGCYDKKLYAVAPDGRQRWTYETGGVIRATSPIVASDGSIYIGSGDGKVYCVEAEGTLRRIYATANEVRTAPILNNGRLYLTGWDYRLYSFDTGQVPASSAWPMYRQNPSRTARRVSPALAIGVQPRAQSAEVNDTITFAVGAVGTAPLSYQWSFNGAAIAGATGQSYRINAVIHALGGQYSVRVTDSTGSITSSNAALTVTTPLVVPSVTTAPSNQTATAGNSATLSVVAAGTFPLTYQWLRDGNAITGATNASLPLDATRLTDSGNYSVRITNFAGTITSPAATLTINPVGRISNLSIRTQVGGASGPLTVGLTIGGGSGTPAAKPLLLRAVGPTLNTFGVDGTLADPQLAVLSGANVIAQNDDWAGNAQVTTTNAAVGAFGFSGSTSKDAALVHSAAAGSYTVRIVGAGESSGIALAEVYDASPSDTFVVSTPRLVNVSALTHVGTDGDILIAGFSITGATPKTVLIRGIGPALAAFGVGDALTDPKLDIFQSGATTAMSSNDNWSSATNATQVATAAKNVGAFDLPSGSKDAVLLVTLPPGSYTAQVSGVGNTTGTALVEVYEVP